MQKLNATHPDRRSGTRYAFNGLVPAQLRFPGEPELEVIYIDVSQRGLGILCRAVPIAIGDHVELAIEGQAPISLEVCWARIPLRDAASQLPPMLRLGLRSQESDVDLVDTFEAFSCLDR